MIVEESVIGSLLIEPSLLTQCDLKPEDFQSSLCRRIFTVILDMGNKNQTVDMITVGERFGEDAARVYAIANTPLSLKSFDGYVDKVVLDSRLRAARSIAIELQEAKEDVDIDAAIKRLSDLNTTRHSYSNDIQTVVGAYIQKVDELSRSGKQVGVRAGLRCLDDSLGGFHDTDLTVIGARPAMGKTALLINLANGCGVPCGFISAEQSSEQIASRLISINGRVSAHHLRLGNISDSDWARVTKSVSVISGKKIWIDDKPAQTVAGISRQAHKWKHDHDIKILYVDYIQRIRERSIANRHHEVEYVVQSLKELARELKIPIVALAQVNRNVESRDDKAPGMSDLKESGAIEQEADNIITLYRDEVYNRNTLKPNIAELRLCKNRHGPTGIFEVFWNKEFMSFANVA